MLDRHFRRRQSTRRRRGRQFVVQSYLHDLLGRVTQVDNAGTPGGPHVVLDSGYDSISNRTSLAATVDGVGDFQNTYAYDALARMTQIQQTTVGQAASLPLQDKRVDLTYNAAGQFSQIDRYEDLLATAHVARTAYTFDTAGQLTDLVHSTLNAQPSTLASYNWTFDAAGHVVTFTNPDGTSNYAYGRGRDQMSGKRFLDS